MSHVLAIRTLKQWTPKEWEFPQESHASTKDSLKLESEKKEIYNLLDHIMEETMIDQWYIGPYLDLDS